MLRPSTAPDEEALAAAAAHERAGNVDQTMQICRRVLERGPNFDAQYLLGLALMRAGRDAEAKEWIDKAVAIEPGVLNCGQDALLRQFGRYSPLDSARTRYEEFKLIAATDGFIISFPKCGRTWVRLLLGKLLQLQFGLPEDGDMLETRALTSRITGVPTVDISHDDYPHFKPAAAIERSKERYRGKTIVLLVRDPRDTIVSYYFQYVRRGDNRRANDAQFNGTMSEFIRHRIGSIDSLVTFYNVWASQRDVPQSFHLLRYEDLRQAPVPTLAQLLKYLNMPEIDQRTIERAVAYCSFENMQRIERGNVLKNIRLATPDTSDPESFKVRRGKVGGYRDYLTPQDIAFIDARLALLDDLYAGYKTAT
ncbi:MAG TPA: sulfotransferase domain-containing protein [Pseudolabrys sp.]|nr:sulfotransferase domain-containing protein [Pseudolabrys sp.]